MSILASLVNFELTEMTEQQKTISIPWWYRYGFLEILPLRLLFDHLYHINYIDRGHHAPLLSLDSLI